MLIDSPLKLELFRILSDFLGLKRVLRTKSLRNAVVEKNSKQSMNVFPGGSEEKRLPAMRETWVRSLGWEDRLEKEMATHSSYSCLENSMDRGAWWARVLGHKESGMTE